MRRDPVDREQVHILTEQGFSAAQIAERLGCAPRAVTRARAALGIQGPHGDLAGARATPERLEQARALIEDGCSQAEVARTLGMSKRTLRRHFPDAQWTSEQVREHQALMGHHAKALR